MNKLIGDARPTEHALAAMRELGGTWAAYQNHDLGSHAVGNLWYLKVGRGCTFETAPEIAPDSHLGPGWRYMLVGYVDLKTGDIRDVLLQSGEPFALSGRSVSQGGKYP